MPLNTSTHSKRVPELAIPISFSLVILREIKKPVLKDDRSNLDKVTSGVEEKPELTDIEPKVLNISSQSKSRRT
jgi:hypothetical protein